MPLSYCQEPADICCQTYDGSTFIDSPADCDKVNGTIVPMELCEEPPVDLCCQLPNGNSTITSTEKCEASGGTIVADEFCEETCCELGGVPVEFTVLSVSSWAERSWLPKSVKRFR